MHPVIYNLNGIRPPITGIGRYAIGLLRGGLQSNLPISAAYAGKIYEQDSLSNLLKQLEKSPGTSGKTLRDVGGFIPYSRQIYRHLGYRSFKRLAKPVVDAGALFHDVNFSASSISQADIATVYDLSNKTCPETHPKHRVKFLDKYFNNLAKSDSHIIAISESIKGDLIEYYGLDRERIDVTHLAADSCFYPRTETQCQNQLDQYGLKFKHYILCVGTIEPRKNLSRVLDAYQSLDSRTQAAFPLVVVGAPGWKSITIEKQIERLRQQSLLIKIGFASQQHLPILYSGAAAFLYPSIYEGFGLPLLEAMQSGCPCVTSDIGALAEVSDHHALQVNPFDSDDIAQNLSRLLLDRELNKQYCLSGPERAKYFSWKKTVTQTRKVYDAI